MGTIPVCICSRTCLIRDKADWHVVLSDYDPELASRECKSNNEKMCWSKIYLDATSLSFMCMDIKLKVVDEPITLWSQFQWTNMRSEYIMIC